jgi:hypothetical protein
MQGVYMCLLSIVTGGDTHNGTKTHDIPSSSETILDVLYVCAGVLGLFCLRRWYVVCTQVRVIKLSTDTKALDILSDANADVYRKWESEIEASKTDETSDDDELSESDTNDTSDNDIPDLLPPLPDNTPYWSVDDE